jgi:hypothetical protein
MSHGHDDFAFEKIRGLPADLPQGEKLLWQGSPTWRSMALNTYYVRWIAVYFGALVLWRIGVTMGSGHTFESIALSCGLIAGLGAVAAGVLAGLAYLSARSTVYSITSARVLLRHGIAVPMTMNIPFGLLEAANLRVRKDGTGDLSLSLLPGQRVAYLVTWPHLSPGYITSPRPSFRSVPDPKKAAEILRAAMLDFTGAGGIRIETPVGTSSPAVRPRSAATA